MSHGPEKSRLVVALQAELNRQYDLGVMTTFTDADGRPMLSYPIVCPAPRPMIDVGKLADAVLTASLPAVEAEAVAWLTTWQRDGEEWVNAHANEVTAIEEARRWNGTCTPLFASPPKPEGIVEALREARQFILAPAEDLLWGVVHRIDAAIAASNSGSGR